MTALPDVPWITVPEVAERIGVKATQVHRLIEDRVLLAARIDGVLKVPEAFLVGDEPMRELRGTIMLLLDSGFTEQESVAWLLAEEDSLGTSPVEALRAGRKAEVRRVAQALAF